MRRGLIAAAIALVLGAVAVVALAGTGGPPPAPATPRASAAAFLDRYVTADGRVVRRDQSGDTVSEGQAYALLLTVATGDERRFATVWRWTASHLQRPDGLLAWHWVGGRLAGRDPATDADLDAARALLVAGRRFGRPAFRAQGIRIGRAVLASETAHGVLVAGPWARGAGIVNPSYSAPRAFRSLGTATGDGRWGALAAASRSATAALTAPAPHLPPDWARMTASGPRATGAPGTSDAPDYGYDAVRVPLRLAESCSPADRALAARMWSALRDAPGDHPAALAGAAAAAGAAGDPRGRDALLARAAQLDASRPTYYGSAVTALARVMLQTRWLGTC